MKFSSSYSKKCAIMIGNLGWDVFLVKGNNRRLFDSDADCKTVTNEDGAFGITYRNTCEIYISEDLSPGNIRRTVIHEITHAFLYSFGWFSERDAASEEDVCGFMETHASDIVKTSNEICGRFLS